MTAKFGKSHQSFFNTCKKLKSFKSGQLYNFTITCVSQMLQDWIFTDGRKVLRSLIKTTMYMYFFVLRTYLLSLVYVTLSNII